MWTTIQIAESETLPKASEGRHEQFSTGDRETRNAKELSRVTLDLPETWLVGRDMPCYLLANVGHDSALPPASARLMHSKDLLQARWRGA
jgi:hypothetical protein